MTLIELVVDLLLDSSDYTEGMQEEIDKAEGYGSAFGDSFLSGAMIIVAGVTAILGTLAGIGVAAFDFSNDFQAANVRMQSELGLTAEEAETLGEVALNVFGNNFFDSIGEATDAISWIRQNIGDLNDQELQRVTEQSAAIADSFDEDFNKVASSAKSLVDAGLVDNFDQAFDMITAGFQSGLNRSEDFLDTVEEYAVQFGNGGSSIEKFFSVLETGLQGGVLGTDKAADMFKEFSLRIFEDSDNVNQALKDLGLADLPGQLESGAISAVEAFDQVVGAVSGAESEAEALRIGTALLGTQFEDLGTAALDGLTIASDTFNDVSGATDDLNVRYNTLGDVFEGLKRQALIALKPLGDSLLQLANFLMPLLLDAFERAKPFIEGVTVAFERMIVFIENGRSPVDTIIALITNLGYAFGLNDQQADLLYGTLQRLVTGFQETFDPIVEAITNFVSWKDVLIAAGIAVGAVLLPILASMAVSVLSIVAPIAAVIAAVALFRRGWESDFMGMRTFLTNVWNNHILPIFDNLKGFVLETLIPTVNELWQKWVNVWFPQIQSSLQTAWAFIQPILNQLWVWFTESLIPTIKHLWDQWVNVWLPDIQLALENSWIVIQTILEELHRWFNENIIPIVEYFYDKWVNEWLPKIQETLETVWSAIKPILDAFLAWFAEKIEPAITAAKDAFNGAITAIRDTLSDAWNNHIKPIFDAIRGFWDWITSANFSFNISIPDLPEWMIPGSPIPLHTRWKDFHEFLRSVDFEPKFIVPDSAMITGALSPDPNRYATNLSGLTALEGLGNSSHVDASNNRFIFPNVTNENAVKGSVAAIKSTRRKRANSWIDR